MPEFGLDADLRIDAPVGELRVTGGLDGLTVTLPHLRAARSLRALVGASRAHALGVLVLDVVLRRAGLTAGIVVRSHELARIGAGANPGVVSRLVGLSPMELRMRGVLGAALARRLPPADG